MGNAYLPRDQVHAWSEDIGNENEAHQASLQRLLKDQKRLVKFIQENAGDLEMASGGVGVYLLGVVARMFDLAGGRLKSATWAQVRDAEAKVGGVAGDLLPLDDGFAGRVRMVEWRAQPHILDEALMALFDRDEDDKKEGEEDLSPAESAKVFFLLWVCTEVLDGNWKPRSDYEGLGSYEYVHIEPTKKDDAEE